VPRTRELPPPLPPEERTIGQLVAEAIRLYGNRFWLALPLGLSVAVVEQAAVGQSANVQTAIVWAGTPLLTASFVGASLLVANETPPRRVLLVALAAGTLAFLPVPVLVRLFILPGVLWLALVGLVVPAVIVERLGFREGFFRARELALADFGHAAGSLATLAIVFFLTRFSLFFLLRSQGDLVDRIAAFLADLVLSPLLFLGGALLYLDQKARVGRRHSRRTAVD
jgi:hypothetical protein